MLNSRLRSFVEGIMILNETQPGFRQGYSTIDHIFVFRCLIHVMCKQGSKLYCAFIDYQKALDTVWRDDLWLKLTQQGINRNSKLLAVDKNVYSNSKSHVF